MQLLMQGEDLGICFYLMTDKGKIVTEYHVEDNDQIERLLDIFEGHKQYIEDHVPFHLLTVISNETEYTLQIIGKNEMLFWNLFDSTHKIATNEIKAVDEVIETLYCYYID